MKQYKATMKSKLQPTEMERSMYEYGHGVFNMDQWRILRKKIRQNSIFELPTLGTLQNKEGKCLSLQESYVN